MFINLSKRLILFLNLLFIAGLLAACTGNITQPTTQPLQAQSATQSSSTEGGELVMAITQDIVSLDPVFAYDFHTNFAVCDITEGLLKFKGEKLEANLAESWENLDPLTYIYHIRKGVTFHDGSLMTIEDVLFSMERARDPKTAAYVGWMYANVDKIEKVDEWTLKVTLKQPDAFWPYITATSATHVVSKVHYETHKETFGKPEGGVIGTGPFKFVSWASGSEIVLEKNEQYWDKANGGPYLDRVILRVVPDPTAIVAGLQNGEIHAVFDVYAALTDQVPVIAKMDHIQLTLNDSFITWFITFNTQRPPFNNIKVRQALNLVLDKAQVVKTLAGETATVAQASNVPPRMWTFEKERWSDAYTKLPPNEFNLEEAKTLLAESGVADQLNGKTITVFDQAVPLGIALAMQDAARQLGITLEIKKMPVQEGMSIGYGGERDYDLIVFAYGGDFPDPAANMVPIFHSRNVGAGGANFPNYHNAAVDQLLDQQGAFSDTGKRTELLLQAQKLIVDDAILINILHPKEPFALNKEFEGYTMSPVWYWEAVSKNIRKK